MKLEVGQFVRTDNGIIGRIYEQIGDMFTYKNNNRDYITYGLLHGEIIKASHNIIDLIEVGDIIKFDITDTDNYADIQGYNCWEISCEEELNGVKEMIEMESAKLISIVTKEMFADAEYRVETN